MGDLERSLVVGLSNPLDSHCTPNDFILDGLETGEKSEEVGVVMPSVNSCLTRWERLHEHPKVC
jgi:hypothetical protein